MTRRVISVILESLWACVHVIDLDDSLDAVHDNEVDVWDPARYTQDTSGRRLFEEVGRRCARAGGLEDVPISGVAITMPGTLLDSRTVVTSSRLNIRTALDVSKVVEDQCELSTRVFHDMPAMATGFATPSADETFAYVSLDEGVGSVIYVNGVAHRGAGVAGSLGRMVVEPEGVYSLQVTARGTLETYVGRPWISEYCVALWEAEQGKRGGGATDEGTPFRRALKTASLNSRQGLPCETLAIGMQADDPIAVHALSTAARYAGFGINSLVAIVHPHTLVLGGRLCTELPGFAEDVERFARLYSWPNSWNAIEFLHSDDSRRDQRLGAAKLLVREAGL